MVWKLENVPAAVLKRTSSPWGAWGAASPRDARRTQSLRLRSSGSVLGSSPQPPSAEDPISVLENTRSSAAVLGARKISCLLPA